MSTINKRFDGSCIFDLVSATNLVEEGSADQALRGEHHNRGMRTYMLVYEALVRMLLQKHVSQLPRKVKDTIQEIVDVPGINIDISQNTKRKILIGALLEDTDFCDCIDNIFTKVEMAISDMAKYWFSFLEMVNILLMHYYAMRTQNWKEYLTSITLMLPWMAIYDSVHYTRYLSLYWAQMNNLTIEQKSFMKQGLFAASMTSLPFSSIPCDQWIEMTMNKESKMKGGWIGFTKTVNFISKI